MKRIPFIPAGFFLLLMLISTEAEGDINFSPEENESFRSAFSAVLQRIDRTVNNLPDTYFPFLGDNISGEWISHPDPEWTGGFWVGMLWLAYENTGEEKYLKWAKRWNKAILGFEEEPDHDRGFVYFHSSVKAYEITGEKRYYQSALKAAEALVALYQKGSGTIPQNRKDPRNVIIDTMMNLQLLWWAADQRLIPDSLRKRYEEVAVSHVERTLRDFIRPDGSTWQSVHYDTLTGEIIKKHTHQGYSDSSCWSRGESWAFYGFVEAYRATGRSDFLQAAEKLGDYIFRNLPQDGVPWYDYNDPDKFKDTSAGAIAASAFLRLSCIVPENMKKSSYENRGKNLLLSLIQGYLTPLDCKGSPPGILQHGCYQHFRYPDQETIWGDYYLMETLTLILEKNK